MKTKIFVKRLLLSLSVFMLVIVSFTVYTNVMVEKAAGGRLYATVDSVPHNKVALLLGTNPLNKWGRPIHTLPTA